MLWHASVYLLIRVVNGAIALVALAVLTRLLAAEAYGRYALAATIVSVVATLVYQWLNVALGRFLPAQRDAPGQFVAAARGLFARLTLGLAVVAGAVVLMAALTRDELLSHWMPLAAVAFVAVVGMGWFNQSLQIANALGRPMHYGVLTVSRAAATLGAAALLVALGGGAVGATAALAVGAAAAALVDRWNAQHVLARSTADLGSDAHADARRRLLAFGAPLTLTFIATMAIDATDRFMLGWWHGSARVGAYAAAADFAQQSVGAVINAVALAGQPTVMRVFERDGAVAARSALVRVAAGAGLLIAPLLFVFIDASRDLSAIIFGATLRDDAAQVLPWVATAIAMSVFRASVFDVALQLNGRTLRQTSQLLAMAVFNIALNAVVIPTHGLRGAAAASTATFAFGIVLGWWSMRNSDLVADVPRTLAKIVGCTIAGLLATRWAGIEPSVGPTGLAVRVGIGLPTIMLTAWLLDLGGLRAAARRLAEALRGRR